MKTTKEHHEKFKRYVAAWQQKLGVTDWGVEHQHKPLEGAYARTWMENEARTAVIALATSWENITDHELDRVAFHEVLHLMMSDLMNEAKARYTDEYDIDRAEHGIIRRLENVIFGLERK